jgi:hypothetical protein
MNNKGLGTMPKTALIDGVKLTQEQRLQIVERFIAQIPNVDELTQEERNEIEIVALAFIDHLQEQNISTRV